MRRRRALAAIALTVLVVTACDIQQDLTPRVDALDGRTDGDPSPRPSVSAAPTDAPTDEPSPAAPTDAPTDDPSPDAPDPDTSPSSTPPEPTEPPMTDPTDPENRAPAANADAASTDEDRAVDIAVLANDRDPDGDPLRVEVRTPPGRGQADVVGTEIRYTPARDANGTDRFTYRVHDGRGGTATATVDVTIRPVNDAPAAADDRVSTAEDTAVEIDVLANDVDVDRDPLTVSDVTAPSKGTARITGDRVTYTPKANVTGTDTFVYTVSDPSGATDSASVTVVIGGTNDPPVAKDDTAVVDEDGSVTINVVDGTAGGRDTDADGDTLTVSSISTPGKGTAVKASGHRITYTPNPNANGADTFTYTVSDGNGGTDTATVSVTIRPVNDAPVAVKDSSDLVQFGGTVDIDVLANDSDPDGDALTVQIGTAPSQGTLTAGPDGTVRYRHGGGFGSGGMDSFTYRAVDPSGAMSAEVSVRVPINRPPIARDDETSWPAYGPDRRFNVITGAGTDTGSGGRDSDPDGDAITLVSSTKTSGLGGITCGSDGWCQYSIPPTFCSPHTSDTLIFRYTIDDGRGGRDTANATVHWSTVC